jgi:hypothetical protein
LFTTGAFVVDNSGFSRFGLKEPKVASRINQKRHFVSAGHGGVAMNHGQSLRKALLLRGALAGLSLTFCCMSAFGQTAATGTTVGSGLYGGTPSSTTTTGAGGGGGTGGAAGTTGAASTSILGSSMLLGNGGTGSPGVTSPTGTTPISASNPLQSFYASPLIAGYGPNAMLGPTNAANTNVSSTPDTMLTGKGTFGVTVYKATTATVTLNNGIKATTGGTGAGTAATTANGFNTIGIRRTPQYYTTVDNEWPVIRPTTSPSLLPPPVSPGQFQATLQSAITQSAALPSRKDINVSVASINDQPIVVLRGTVATPEERKLAEDLLRLTPGVRVVRNEIQVQPR